MTHKKLVTLTLLIILGFYYNCKNETDNNNFKLIERNSYFIDSYNGISVYRNNENRKPMSGYFVVGDKFKKWEEFKVKEGILNGAYIIFHNNGKIFSQSHY